MKYNDMLFYDKKSSINDNIENIFTNIEGRSGESDRKCPPSNNDATSLKVTN